MRSLPLLIAGMLLVQLVFAQSSTTFQPTFRESKRTPHKISKKQDFTFGYLEVLEDLGLDTITIMDDDRKLLIAQINTEGEVNSYTLTDLKIRRISTIIYSPTLLAAS